MRIPHHLFLFSSALAAAVVRVASGSCFVGQWHIQQPPSSSSSSASPPAIRTARSKVAIVGNGRPFGVLEASSGSGFGGASDEKQNDKNQQRERTRKPDAAEFEYQELKIQLEAMKLQGVAPRDLDPLKRLELASYAKAIVERRGPRSLPLNEIGAALPGTEWRLAFSTQETTLGDLPADATVLLKFLDENTLDYVLSFGKKTFGLENIKARSRWTFDASDGVLTFVYDRITTDAFGMSNVGVGLFGLLKGRANYVESAYFDDAFWIERGLNPDGTQEFWNVYVREE